MVEHDAQAPARTIGEPPAGGTAEPPAGQRPDPDTGHTIWDERTANAFRDRWRDAQVGFVDDPPAAVDAARALVDEVTATLVKVVNGRRQELDLWSSGGESGTEDLRVVLRRYRDFFDHLLGI